MREQELLDYCPHASNCIRRVTFPGMIGVIQAGWYELLGVNNQVWSTKLPGRPAHVILVRVVQESVHELIRVLHGRSLASNGNSRIETSKEKSIMYRKVLC